MEDDVRDRIFRYVQTEVLAQSDQQAHAEWSNALHDFGANDPSRLYRLLYERVMTMREIMALLETKKAVAPGIVAAKIADVADSASKTPTNRDILDYATKRAERVRGFP